MRPALSSRLFKEHNGAADKPKALTADVGLICVVVVLRGAPSNQRSAERPNEEQRDEAL